jgi:hypothetical protein
MRARGRAPAARRRPPPRSPPPRPPAPRPCWRPGAACTPRPAGAPAGDPPAAAPARGARARRGRWVRARRAAAPAAWQPRAHKPASSGGCRLTTAVPGAPVAGVKMPFRRFAARRRGRSGVRRRSHSASRGAQPGRAHGRGGCSRSARSMGPRRAASLQRAQQGPARRRTRRAGHGRAGPAAQPGAGAPTCTKTSSAACATTPASSARASAASSITPPRATFTTRAPRFILANAASPKMPCAPPLAADPHALRWPAPTPGLASACSAAPRCTGRPGSVLSGWAPLGSGRAAGRAAR